MDRDIVQGIDCLIQVNGLYSELSYCKVKQIDFR